MRKEKVKREERREKREREEKRVENGLQLQRGPFGEFISSYSYRRAPAGELVLHYITVGASTGI